MRLGLKGSISWLLSFKVSDCDLIHKSLDESETALGGSLPFMPIFESKSNLNRPCYHDLNRVSQTIKKLV